MQSVPPVFEGRRHRMYRYVRLASLIVVLLLVFSGVSTPRASADGRAAQRGYLIGVPPNVGPDIARAGNGDTIEFTGTGTFTPGSRRATGFGFFVHKNVAGDTLAVGSWTATRLLSFRSFGSPSRGTGGLGRLRAVDSVRRASSQPNATPHTERA